MSDLIDLATVPVRSLNAALHELDAASNRTLWRVLNPRGQHALAVGVDAPVRIEIAGHAGYYCAGMNQGAHVVIEGNAGNGVAENMMSGRVHVRGDASAAAGATAHGGMLVIEGNAAARCGISMKGVDIVVGGNVGHMSAFMAQARDPDCAGQRRREPGRQHLRGAALRPRQRGEPGRGLREKELRDEHRAALAARLTAAGLDADPATFRRYGSARRLYHFHVDNAGEY